jgi:hypothetical protein
VLGEAGMKAWAERSPFARFRAGFGRSKKGNLWRHYEGRNLTMFRRRDDSYAWVIGDDLEGGPQFSQDSWETEADAMEDLARELEIVCDEESPDDR